MRETPAEHAARTGAAYAPPAVAGARPLGEDEPCPTLFRYPGAGALHETLARGLPSLAPPGAPVIWLAEDPRVRAAAARFGTLAVLEPLALSPARVGDVYVAAAQPVHEDGVIWVPPSAVAAGGAAWDAIATPAAARAWLGRAWDEERARVLDELGVYLEETVALARVGIAPPPEGWSQVPPGERARILAEHGLTPRWAG